MHAIARTSLRRPAATLALLALVTLGLGSGALRLESEAGYRAFLGAEHPALRELDAFVERFGGGLPFAAVWSCRESSACASVFDRASLAMAHDVARSLEATPGVRRVDGPATSGLLAPVLFELPEARTLFGDGEPHPELDALAGHALRAPSWVGQIVSGDGQSGALLVHLESSDARVGARVLHRLRALLAPHEARGFVFHLVGGPVEFVVAGDELARNTARIVPLMVVLVALVLALLFRSWLEAGVALLCVGAAVAWTLGLMGWLGWPQNSLTQALAPLVLVIGVCDAMHVLAGYATALGDGRAASRREREDAMQAVARQVGGPCLLTTLTTAAGFASFAVSGLASFVRFGWVAAFGVCAALLLTFTLLPILTVRAPLASAAPPRVAPRWERALSALVAFSRERAVAVVAASLLLLGLALSGFAMLRVDASFEDLYGEQSQVVRWVEAASLHLRAPETLEIALDPADGLEPHAPAALRVVAAVETLAELDGLAAALSILTPLREAHALAHRDELPLDDSGRAAERAGQMLRLLRFEDPDLLRLFVDPKGGYRVSLQSRKLPQAELRDLLAEVDVRLARLLPEGWSATVTGPLAVVGTLVDEIRSTQLRSFTLAGGLVLALVALFLRSLPMAMLALLPTALPVLVTLGAMGWAGVPLDVGTAMAGAVLLGLAVDDVIHLLTAFRRHRDAGSHRQVAVGAAVHDVGRALVTSSAALATGFLVLAFSPWRSLASFGLVASLAIAAALAAVLVLLPALLTLSARVRARPAAARSR
ncbi:MAG: efflux RND transporter permease subunit [Myxococcota bacterium]|nr:efflux RND transporter permease subunit [Myxococcota bacterium]